MEPSRAHPPRKVLKRLIPQTSHARTTWRKPDKSTSTVSHTSVSSLCTRICVPVKRLHVTRPVALCARGPNANTIGSAPKTLFGSEHPANFCTRNPDWTARQNDYIDDGELTDCGEYDVKPPDGQSLGAPLRHSTPVYDSTEEYQYGPSPAAKALRALQCEMRRGMTRTTTQTPIISRGLHSGLPVTGRLTPASLFSPTPSRDTEHLRLARTRARSVEKTL